MFLNWICLNISSDASKFVFNAVISIFFSDVDRPEFISILVRASVGFITKYPPDFK